MVSLGLSVQVMADVQISVVDIDNNTTIEARRGVAVEIYIRLDGVEGHIDPNNPTIQAVQCMLTDEDSVLDIDYTTDPLGNNIPAVVAFDVTEGNEVLEAWPVYASFVDNIVGNPINTGLAMNPVDPDFFDPVWYTGEPPEVPQPDPPWEPNEDGIYYLPTSGMILKISATVKADAPVGDHNLCLSELPDGSGGYLAIINEWGEESEIPYEIVPECSTLRVVDGDCPIPWTYHAYPLATCNFWGFAKISGVDVQVGDVIGAFVSDVEVNDGCIGYFEVTEDTVRVRGIGEYGLLPTYGDDPTTPEKDGAYEGDVVTFKILDRSDCKIYSVIPQGPDESIWNKDTTKNVNLDTIPPPTLYEPQVADQQVNLTWSSVTGASGYKVYRSTTSGVYTDPPVDVGDTLAYEDTTVSNGTTYYYVVTAYQDNTESGYSNEVFAIPPFGLHTSNVVAWFWGTVTIDGEPAPEGDIVAVFAPDVVTNDGCIGYFIVGSEGEGVIVSAAGEYGLLNAYGDDPTTPEKDGAYEEDVLTFKIWDASEDVILEGGGVSGIIFEAGTTKEVNLAFTTTFELYLAENWNLISWPVAVCFYQDAPPTDPLPAGTQLINISDLGFTYMAHWFTDVLEPCNPDFPETPWRLVQGAHPGGAAVALDSEVPERFHTLKYMSGGYGYWIKIKEGTGGAKIVLSGSRLAPDVVLSLAQNWNLVGYTPSIGYYDTDTPPANPIPCDPNNLLYATPDCSIQKVSPVVDYVFSSIAGQWRLIQGARPGGAAIAADSAVPPRFWTLHDTFPGCGYWIKANNDVDLTYPADICPSAGPSTSSTVQIVPSREVSVVKPTNLSMFIYGTASLDGNPAPVGSRITVWTLSGVLVGEGTVEKVGEYEFLPIYGDDTTTPKLDGALMGDELIVKVNGHSVSQSIRWLGDHIIQQADLVSHTRIIPSSSWLGQNYPNPFNPETWLPYALSESSEVTIKIYDVHGSLVNMLHIGHKPAGVYDTKNLAAYWDGRNDAGERVSSGLYFYKLTAGQFTQVKRMVILK
jgi:hypothetical protein